MSLETVRVLWKSHPYGWLLRWFNVEGHYAAELLCSAPPYRALCSGSLNSADAANAWRLVLATLASAATEAPASHANKHIGYVVPVVTEGEQISPYYYYPQNDKRDSTRHFVHLVLIIDSYMRAHYQALIDDDAIWNNDVFWK